MQDTDITSSISPLLHVQDYDVCEKLGTGKGVKKLLPRKPPTSLIMETVYTNEEESEPNGAAKHQGSELLKSLGENFPWLIKFSRVIESSVGSKNAKLLDRLLSVYIKNMSRDVNKCYTKPHRAAKLKTQMSETLIFFHLYWKNIKERVDDHNQYLDKMSQILGMYFDMELKASRRGKDLASKIAAKLLTAMFIYLDNSEEHIFRVLLRAKFITKNYSQICSPIFTKLFAGLSGRTTSITAVTYARYLLALKLWKRIKDDLQEKKNINELGVAILGHRTPISSTELGKILPNPPECHKNGTLWLLQPNSFDLRKACDSFIKYELSEHIISLPDTTERFKVTDSIDVVPSAQINLESTNRLQKEDIVQLDKSLVELQTVKKVVKLRRFKPSFPKLRPGEVVFIDLTAENDEQKQKENGKKKKKKDKKKLKWLREVRKKSKIRKERKILDKTWIEKTDAHSTEDNNEETESNSSNRPISEDKVTESTERMERTLVNINRFGKRVTRLRVDSVDGTKQEKNKCNVNCKGCKFCHLMGQLKYTTIDRMEDIERSENLIKSQSSPLNKDDTTISVHTTFAECVNEELQGSGAYNIQTVSESCGSYYDTDQVERKNSAESTTQEPLDVIDDSTTDKNCDKLITTITNTSSFNITNESEKNKDILVKRNVSSPNVKLEAGHTTEIVMPIPSKSSCQNSQYISNVRDHSKMRKGSNETCVTSTTASIFGCGTEEQINVISGSKSEPTIQEKECDLNLGDNNKLYTQDIATIFKKLVSTSKKTKSLDVSNDNCKNRAIKVVNNKLQNILIHALSFDEVIEVGKDDIDSQSEDDEGKGYCSKSSDQEKKVQNFHKELFSSEDLDFFQIPSIQLCDDLTNNNDVESLGDNGKVDEFENIDILDSILNGYMSMQDVLEDQQHLPMTSGSNETSSANVMGFFTEFLRQSETAQSADDDYATEEACHSDVVPKSLPEGSLGTTGILNSLLDSDLTSMDSPPSDFMYSNVQTVDPRLIRRSPTAERSAFLNDFSTVSDLFSQCEQSSDETFQPLESLAKKTKDQLFLDEKDSLNCMDLEEFRLNSNKRADFEMPLLEEELIQLPQHPLIDDAIITQISVPTRESQMSNRSEIDNLNEVKSMLQSCIGSQEFNNMQQLAENSYDYSKLNNFKDFASFKLRDIIQHSPNSIDHSVDLPTTTLTDFTPPHSVDAPQSPYTFASSPAPVHVQTVPYSPTHSIGASCHQISTNMLTPPPSTPQLSRQNNLTPPPTPQQSQNPLSETLGECQSQAAVAINGNIQEGAIRYFTVKSQFCSAADASNDDLQERNSCMQSKIATQKVQNKIMYITRSKKCAKSRTRPTEIEKDETAKRDEDQSLHLSQVQVALTRLPTAEMKGRDSGDQSLFKSHFIVKREGDISSDKQLKAAQLQRIDLRKLSIAAAQKNNKSVLINLNGKTKPALVFERNTVQGDKLLKSMNNDPVGNRHIIYKLTPNVTPATSKDKPYSKLPKVNFTLQNRADDVVSKTQSTAARSVSSNIGTQKDQVQKIIKPRSYMRRGVKTQANQSGKELNVRKTFTVPNTEEPSLKRRKITTKLMPSLENESIIYTVNQPKPQEKHSNVIRREISRRDRTKKKFV
ncbi:uncharacterized protein LOC124404550 [Diprion similis]|uniref:uncharacterized protein LOC124404550 n=1 Tax=Diprion similis TaxID=362088 RepID=UPI001EF8407F|nr:uncharacterized protein LOC124404550 [Diprion similis]